MLFHHALDDAKAHGVGERTKHAREVNILFRGVNELNHEKTITYRLTKFNSSIIWNLRTKDRPPRESLPKGEYHANCQ